MRERMVEEMEVVRLRMIRRSDMPDMVNCITSQYSTPEYEDGPPSVIANQLPYPDATTVKAMRNRERELKSFNQTQRAYALSLGTDGICILEEIFWIMNLVWIVEMINNTRWGIKVEIWGRS